MSRAVDKYGINIRNAALQTELTNLGINANVNALSQADKAMLRTIVILNSSEYAWGDLSDTLDQPANLLRVLKNQFALLGRAIGNLFLPMVQKVLPFIIQVTYALRELAEWIYKVLGLDTSGWDKVLNPDNSGMSDMLDDMEGVGDSLDDAKKKAKEFKAQLQGFDKLNNLTSNDDTDKDNGKNLGGIDSGLLGSALDDAMSRYLKVWDESFEHMNQSFSDFADNVKKAFEEGGLYGVGSYFAETITNGLNSIPWDTVKTKAGEAGTAIAEFLNGLTNPALFEAAGTAFSEGINTVFSFLDGFVEEYDFGNLGESISTGLNTANSKINWETIFNFTGELGTKLADFVNGITGNTDWELAGITIANWFSSVTIGAEEFVTNVNWGDIGEAIGGFVNGLTKYKWNKLGKTISKSVKGILTSITAALKKVDWEKVGKSIATFIKNIDWAGIAWNFTKMVSSLVNAISKVIKGWVTKDPFSAAIVALFAGAKLSGLTKTIKTLLSSKLASISKIKWAGLAVSVTGFSLLFDEMKKKNSDIKTELLEGLVANVGIFALAGIGGLAVSLPITLGLIVDDWVWDTYMEENYQKDIESGLFKPLEGDSWAIDLINKIVKVFEDNGWDVDIINHKLYSGWSIGFDFRFEIDKLRLKIKQMVETIKAAFFGGLSGTLLDDIFGGKFTKAAEDAKNNIDIINKQLDAVDKIQDAWNDRNNVTTSSPQGIANSLALNVKFDASTTGKYDSTMADAKVGQRDTTQKFTAKMNMDDKDSKSVFDSIANGFKTNLSLTANKNLSDKNSKDTFDTLSKTAYSATLTGTGSEGRGIANVAEMLKTKGGTSTLTGVGFYGKNLKNVSKMLGTKGATSTLTGKGVKGTNLAVVAGMLTTKSITSTLTGKGAQDKKKTLSDVVGKLNTGDKLSTLTVNAQFSSKSDKDAINAMRGVTAGFTTNIMMSVAGKKASGGILPKGSSSWKDFTGIKRYAAGGFPNYGTLFWAGEAGAEVVGNTARGTEVLNQSQLAQAMAESMESANAQQNAYIRQQNELLRQQNQLLSAILDKTGITEGDIFSAVRNADRNYRNVNGRGAFVY